MFALYLLIGFGVLAATTILAVLAWLFLSARYHRAGCSPGQYAFRQAGSDDPAKAATQILKPALLAISAVALGTAVGASTLFACLSALGDESSIRSYLQGNSGYHWSFHWMLLVGLPHLLAALTGSLVGAVVNSVRLFPLLVSGAIGTIAGSFVSIVVWASLANIQGLNPAVFAGFSVAALTGIVVLAGCQIASEQNQPPGF